MATYTLKLRNDVFNYKFKTNLSGVVYSFTLRYNGRMDRWIMDTNDVAGNPILTGIVLLINRIFLTKYPTLNIIPGTLGVVDLSGKGIQPTQFSFGVNNFLVYII